MAKRLSGEITGVNRGPKGYDALSASYISDALMKRGRTSGSGPGGG